MEISDIDAISRYLWSISVMLCNEILHQKNCSLVATINFPISGFYIISGCCTALALLKILQCYKFVLECTQQCCIAHFKKKISKSDLTSFLGKRFWILEPSCIWMIDAAMSARQSSEMTDYWWYYIKFPVRWPNIPSQ
jgi:hypothetical protein